MWMSALLCALLGTGVYSQLHPPPPDNLALRGQTVQSSSYDNWYAAKAIDSVKSSCTHTACEDNPWWRLDLLNSYNITRIVITNRPDCCPERLDGAEIHIGNSLENNGNNNPRCDVLMNITQGASATVFCHMEGRYVNVIIPGPLKWLTLCEVEVYQTDYIEKTFVMMKFLSSVNAAEASVSNTLLKQMKTVLTSKGLSDFNLTWTKLPQEVKEEVKQKPICI